MPNWLLIFPVLGFLVFVHELGHFVAAKRFGIRVTEFGFGFPPRLFGVRYGDTLYSFNWIPLGGFVKMVGEEDPTDPRSFARRGVASRAIVLVAGAFMNLVVPVVIFTILFMLPHDTLLGGTVVITGVAPGSPAQQAGLRRGDAILSVGGERVLDVEDLVDAVKANAGRPVALNLRRGGLVAGLGSSPEFAVYETVEVVPRETAPDLRVVEDVGDPASEVSLAEARRYDSRLEIGDILTQRFIGVMIGLTNVRVGKTTDPVWVAFPKSFATIWDILVFTKNGVVEGITTGSNPGIAGPVGIAQATGEVVDRLGISWVFQLTALLSVSLAVVNLVPIPALDGGRLMFVMIEWVRRGKRISPKREGLAHLVGFVIVIGFLVFFTYQDVLRILSGESMVP